MRQRVVLWGALTVLAVGAAVLVVVVSPGSQDGPGQGPPLPLALTDETGEGAAPGQDGPTASAAAAGEVGGATGTDAPLDYAAGDALPRLGGEGTAYRLAAGIDEHDVAHLADALGIEDEPVSADDTWQVLDGAQALRVLRSDGTWWFRRRPAGDRSSTPAQPGERPTGARAESAESVACPDEPGGSCTRPSPSPAPSTVARAAEPAEEPVPEDEARRIARELLDTVGLDLDGADVRVDGGTPTWQVTAVPTRGGIPVPARAAGVAVGPGGDVIGAWGVLGEPQALGTYPLVTTDEALARLREGGDVGRAQLSITRRGTASVSSSAAATPVTPPSPPAPTTSDVPTGGSTPDAAAEGGTSAGAPAPDTSPMPTPRPEAGTSGPTASTVTVPGAAQRPGPLTTTGVQEPQPAPGPTPAPDTASFIVPDTGATGPAEEPRAVTVTDAEVVLAVVPSWDDSGRYLVPAYRFTTDDDRHAPVVPAVANDALALPDGTTTTPG